MTASVRCFRCKYGKQKEDGSWYCGDIHFNLKTGGMKEISEDTECLKIEIFDKVK